MKLINKLKSRVESYRDYIVSEDPFNRAILEGRGNPDEIARFLVDVHYLVHHTPIHLKLAIKASEKYPALQKYYKEKFLEEQGHDQWALDDLAHLSQGQDLNNPTVSGAMKTYVSFVEKTIKQDPYLYLPYIFFAEYLVVIYGPQMTAGMAKSHGEGSLTVIENHSELDKDHVDEWEEIMGTIVDEKKYEKTFLAMIDDTIRLHKKFFAACREVRHEAA